MTLPRREFLSLSAAAAGAFALSTPAARALTPSKDVRIGVIGVRGRGFEHMQAFAPQLAAVCDVDSAVLAERAGQFESTSGRKLARYGDYRQLLDDRSLDAVSIATPNHTHALLAIAALAAGKHVYVEKPVSHNIWEGRQLVAAAEKARERGLVTQCGTQARSTPCLQQAVAWIRGGGLGKIQHALGACYKPRTSIGKLDAPLAIPKTVDYDLWCGPAAIEDIFRPQFHYDWHWDYNTGAGDIGNQGIHQMDIARWFLGEERLAPRAISVGARVGYDDAGETPNSQIVFYDYPAAPLIFETRGLPRSKAAQAKWGQSMDRYRRAQIGVIVQCEGGYAFAPSDYTHVSVYDRKGVEIKRFKGKPNHFQNWIDAILAGDPDKANGRIREGHASTALCHVANVSHRLGEPRTAAEIAEAVAGNELFSDSFERLASHLRANEVDVDGAPILRLGAELTVDPEAETFVDDARADALRTREYRDGYAVPTIEGQA